MTEDRKWEIRIAADEYRAKCKESRFGIIDLFRECERSGYKLIRCPLGESADLGFTLKRDKDIIICIWKKGIRLLMIPPQFRAKVQMKKNRKQITSRRVC